MLSLYHTQHTVPQTVAHLNASHATNTEFGASYMSALLQNAQAPHEHAAPSVLSVMDEEPTSLFHPPKYESHEIPPTCTSWLVGESDLAP